MCDTVSVPVYFDTTVLVCYEIISQFLYVGHWRRHLDVIIAILVGNMTIRLLLTHYLLWILKHAF